jgi:excisionase family DNA binding protein
MTRRSRPVGKLWTLDELAEQWQVSPRTIQRLIKSGALRASRIGRLVRISAEDAEDFLDKDQND